MRNINIFRTTKRDHYIPRDVMMTALRLSPGKDWTDPSTDAYEHIKRWALSQDDRIDRPLPELRRKEIEESVDFFNYKGHPIYLDDEIREEAQRLSPGQDINDKRTKAYKFLENYAKGRHENDKETPKTH